jgi:hypothetical protein
MGGQSASTQNATGVTTQVRPDQLIYASADQSVAAAGTLHVLRAA